MPAAVSPHRTVVAGSQKQLRFVRSASRDLAHARQTVRLHPGRDRARIRSEGVAPERRSYLREAQIVRRGGGPPRRRTSRVCSAEETAWRKPLSVVRCPLSARFRAESQTTDNRSRRTGGPAVRRDGARLRSWTLRSGACGAARVTLTMGLSLTHAPLPHSSVEAPDTEVCHTDPRFVDVSFSHGGCLDFVQPAEEVVTAGRKRFTRGIGRVERACRCGLRVASCGLRVASCELRVASIDPLDGHSRPTRNSQRATRNDARSAVVVHRATFDDHPR